jgi:hypothetical protein
LFGSEFTGRWEFGYSATVSNGRARFLVDESDGKALGVRLTATHAGDERTWKLGTSGYYGDAEEYSRALDFSTGTLEVDRQAVYRFDEWAAGADLSLDWGGFRLRTEALIHHVRYEDGLHEPSAFAAPGRFRPNRYESSWYSIFAYRIGAIEPYTYTELVYTAPRDNSADLAYVPSLGLNVHFSPFTQLKAQYVAPKFYYLDDEDDQRSSRNFRMIDTRLVMSF